MRLLPVLLLVFPIFCRRVLALYNIGVGIADVTGPIAQVGFMGYGKFDQRGSGLHLRQWARSYIIGDDDSEVVFVTVDVGMIGDGLRLKVLERLASKFGNEYNTNNVIISGTHTHSAPGGFLMHFLFDLPIWGFSASTFEALVSGITESIEKAHYNKVKGRVYLAKGQLKNANINRSPTAYLENPLGERLRYENDTDTEMVQLQFKSINGNALGVINWFPVHPVSMKNNNTYVSSDNVGYASIKFEEKMNPNELLGKGSFVGAFASSNLGDVSPNILGARCLKTGDPCDIPTSSCADPNDQCVGEGPGKDMFESTAIIADRLYRKAWELWTGDSTEVYGPIMSVHQYVDMTREEAELITPDGKPVTVKGCYPAMGYSFAAGTTDGPGAFSFKQGTLSTNPMWNVVTNILTPPTEEDIQCHFPKPILLATGRMSFPFEWQPKIVSTQIALIGYVSLIAVPGEFTTMAGRRMRDAITELLFNAGYDSPTAVIAGLSNTYSDYITTYEEYQVQRYEAASTIYGPHTLTLYIQQYRKLLSSLLEKNKLDPGPKPQGLTTDKLTFIKPVLFDMAGIGSYFGKVVQQPPSKVAAPSVVTARFVSGNPRNNLMHGKTFCTIEFEESPLVWKVIATDANWETKVHWIITNYLLGNSETEVIWTVPESAKPGNYRIRHFGNYKNIFGFVSSYSGTTNTFRVLSSLREE